MTSACKDGKPNDVVLFVTDEGQYLLEGKPVPLAELRDRLRALRERNGQVELHVQGGPNVKYEHVAPAMKAVMEEGLSRLAFITEPAMPSASSGQNRP